MTLYVTTLLMLVVLLRMGLIYNPGSVLLSDVADALRIIELSLWLVSPAPDPIATELFP